MMLLAAAYLEMEQLLAVEVLPLFRQQPDFLSLSAAVRFQSDLGSMQFHELGLAVNPGSATAAVAVEPEGTQGSAPVYLLG
jgi:hypothetical protein